MTGLPIESGLSSSPPSPPLGRCSTALAGALVVIAGVIAYAGSLRGPFIFDDIPAIPENPAIRQLWPLSPILQSNRPVIELTLAINHALGGVDPLGYHLFNVTIHLLAGLMLLGVVRRTLSLMPGWRHHPRAALVLATTAALLWTVHPLQTQAVTYIIQRAESLAGLLLLATLYAGARAMISPSAGGRVAWGAAMFLACLVGMMTKPIMVGAPLLLVLYDRTFVAGTVREALRRRWALHLAAGATWLGLAVVLRFGQVVMEAGAAGGFRYARITPWQYLRTQAGVVVHYLMLAVWPLPPNQLVLDYGWSVAPLDATLILPAAILLTMLGITAWGVRRRSWIGFLGATFFLVLAPSSSIMPLADVAMEHRMYLPLACVLLVGLAGVGWMARRTAWTRWPAGARNVAVAAAVLVATASLTLATIDRNRDYRSAVAIWQDTVAKRPDNARARSNLGALLMLEGHADEAMTHLDAALAIEPDDADALVNRGYIRIQLGQYARAIDDLTRALAIRPNFMDAHNNRGLALMHLNQPARALGDFIAAVNADGGYAGAWMNRGNAEQRLGRYAESITSYNRAVTLDPNLASAFHNRAVSHAAMENYAQAWADLRRCRELGEEPNAEFVRVLTELSGGSKQGSPRGGGLYSPP